MKLYVALLPCIGLLAEPPTEDLSAPRPLDQWTSLAPKSVTGVFGDSLSLWRTKHLWRVAKDPSITGILGPAGDPRNEHLGQWLDAASQACDLAHDPKIDLTLRRTVKRLLATPAITSREIAGERSILLGLLSYEREHPDYASLRACERIGDVLVRTLSEGNGVSPALLEPVAALYGRTGDERYLDLAQNIAKGTGSALSEHGGGSAQQLMSLLLGYVELARYNGSKEYRQAAISGWERIQADDLANGAETCATATWIQLSLSLFRLTGQARFAAEAERALFNQLMEAQSPDGAGWATHLPANAISREYSSRLSCCASNAPRALETFARHLAVESPGAIAINSYLPFEAVTEPVAGREVRLSVRGSYPFGTRATIRFNMAKSTRFAVDFRPPQGASQVTVRVAGLKQNVTRTEGGFLRLERLWRNKETAQLDFTFPIEPRKHIDGQGNQWIAFTWGPVALARTIGTAEDVESFRLPAPGFSPRFTWLEPAGMENSVPRFRIKGTSEILIPYTLAGRGSGGYQTLFRVADTVMAASAGR